MHVYNHMQSPLMEILRYNVGHACQLSCRLPQQLLLAKHTIMVTIQIKILSC